MSATTSTTPEATPTLLKYAVEIQPVTHSSGQIILTITPPEDPTKNPVFCKSITIEVPIGPGALDMFTKAPVIRSMSGWAPSSYISTMPALAASGTAPVAASGTAPTKLAPTAVQRFVVLNQNADKAVEPFSITITGNVNTVEARDEKGLKRKPQLKIEEISGPTKAALEAAGALQKATIDLTKAHSRLLYIDSFYASDALLGELPSSKVLSNKPFKLSWESNGTGYDLYQDNVRVGPNAGETTSHELPTGIRSDTTFVLMATKDGAQLYSSLTVAVSNPTYSPGPELQPITSILKSAISGIDGYQLREALQTRRGLEPPVGNKLKNALAETKDEKVKMAFSQYRYQFNYEEAWIGANYGQAPPTQYKTLVNNLNDSELKKGLLLSMNSRYRNYMQSADTRYVLSTLEATSDVTLKAALRETKFPLLLTLLALPVTGTTLQTAIKQQEDAALLEIFDDENLLKCLGHFEEIAVRTAIADARAKATLDNKNYNLSEGPDTTFSLRVSNGNVLGNIVAQALSGDSSGMATLSFNGYFDGSHKQFNPTKARFRLGTNQRAGADFFFIDTYKGASSPKLAFAITADGNVGIGTNSPIAPLHVNGGVKATDVAEKHSYFRWDVALDVGRNRSAGGSRSLSAYFEGGQFWVNDFIVAGAMNVSSDRRIKHVMGVSDCAADLDLLKKIRVTNYTYIDTLANTDQVMKKLIAQEIQGLMPSAVNTNTQAVPNVYERAAHVSFADGRVTVTTAKAHELPATGGKMRLYTPANTDVNADATVVDAHTFSFASNEAYETGLFVYGKFVDDFLSVDYDAVAMLNVSATQALARQVDELHQQNAAMNEQFQTQGAQVDELRAALLLLQQQVAGLLSETRYVAQPA
jgi:hypothetical protein